jgi:hypothetical protein
MPARQASAATAIVKPSGTKLACVLSTVTPPCRPARKVSRPAWIAELAFPAGPDAGSQQIATATIATTAPTKAAPTPVQIAASQSERPARDGTTAGRTPPLPARSIRSGSRSAAGTGRRLAAAQLRVG